MLVAIHQRHYLPWLGYLHRMAQADLFVLLDHVQFERGNYQNRTRVRVNVPPQWLTVPLVYGSQSERILDKIIDRRVEWPGAHFEALRRAYTSAGYFGRYAAQFGRVYEAGWERLVDLNDALLAVLRDAFGIGLSAAVDLLFNRGPASRDLLLGSTARECRIAA